MFIVKIKVLILKNTPYKDLFFDADLKIIVEFIKFFIIKFVGLKKCLLICSRFNTTHYGNREFNKHGKVTKTASNL